MKTHLAPFVFEELSDGDWRSATPDHLIEAVLSVRSLADQGFFRADVLLKKEEKIRREPCPWEAFGTCYRERMKEATRAAHEVFDAFLQIAVANSTLIGATPISWSYGQTAALLRSQFGSSESLQEWHKLKHWVMDYCDGPDPNPVPSLSDEEALKRYLRRDDWRAPSWLRLAASRAFAGASCTWDDLSKDNGPLRLSRDETESLLDGICRWFWSAIESALQNKASLESIELASQLHREPETGSVQGENRTSSQKSQTRTPNSAKKTQRSGASRPLMLKYRSGIKRMILAALTKNPNATDLEVCRLLDADGGEELPAGWKTREDDRSFFAAYANPRTKRNVEIAISKIRRDLRDRGLLG